MADVPHQRTHSETLYYIMCVAWLAAKRALMSFALAFVVVFGLGIAWYVPLSSIHNCISYKLATSYVTRDLSTVQFSVQPAYGDKVRMSAFQVVTDPYIRTSSEFTLSRLAKYARIASITGAIAALYGAAGLIRRVTK